MAMQVMRVVLALIAVFAVGACTQPSQDDAHAGHHGSDAHDHDGHEGDGTVPDGVARQYAMVNAEIAEHGGETISGEWRVAYVIGPAKSWHVADGDDYRVREPAPGETHHIEIIPFEAATGRIIPDVPIRLEVLDSSGQVVGAEDLNFYFSDFFHYANNFAVPAPGRYTLRATLDAPTFLRHDHSGHGGGHGGPPALAKGTTVEFPDVEINPGS